MIDKTPDQRGGKLSFKSRYPNHIAGKSAAPVKGMYFEYPSPVNGKTFRGILNPAEESPIYPLLLRVVQ